MNRTDQRPVGRTALLIGSAIAALLGAAVLVFLHGEGLTRTTHYHLDLTQSPHWVAYHGDAFAEDDLLVEYATYNESPVQNFIYRIGGWFVDVVPLNKIVGILIFGLTAALFFALASRSSGLRVGVLAALLFMIFPRSTYEIAGGFSKAWAIGFVLLAVHLLDRRAWRVLLWLMPLAAVTYPMAAVLIGAIVAVGLVLEYLRDRAEALRGLKYLAAGGGIALLPLLYKYLIPPPRIGEMLSNAELRELWAKGESSSLTLPMWQEPYQFLGYPFLVYGGMLLLISLRRRGLVWKRSWTAVAIDSAACYQVAALVVPRLYLPDRYVRYSFAVVLVLWFAHNWARALEIVPRPWLRRAALALVVTLAALSFDETFRPCRGEQDQGLWQRNARYEEISRAIAALPDPVLVAGYPEHTGHVMVQSGQPVLTIHRLFHPWFLDYSSAIDERIRATVQALLADDTAQVNLLAERYGVTHLIVDKRDFTPLAFRSGKLFRTRYRPLIAQLTATSKPYVLQPPPADSVVFRDRRFWVVRLPLE